MGNPSKKGIANSAGLMVNYKYQMDNLEKNHEQYFSRETIASSKFLLSKFNKVKKS
jgi:malonyl-CoA decarboxylase